MSKHPKLSVKQLAEYLHASSTKRRTILAQAKDLQPFIVKRHEAAKGAMTEFLSSPLRSPADLARRVQDFSENVDACGFSSDQQERMATADLKVLKAFSMNQNGLNLGGLNFTAWKGTKPRHVINGVHIPLPLDLTQTRKIKGTEFCGGAALLVTATPDQESDRKKMAQIMASLIWRGLRDTKAMKLEPHTSLCLCIDPIVGVTTAAPAAQTNRQRQLEDACEEIKIMWPHV